MASTESTTILKIDSLAYGPYGVGRKDGQVIFVPLTAPGDEAEVRIRERKRNYAIGELTRLLTPSPIRQTPPCPYFAACGGCPWQHIPYETQLRAKEKSVADALRRIGKLHGLEFLPILASPQEYHYRGRIRLHADKQRRVGFHRAFSRELIEIDACVIADPRVSDPIRHAGEWIRTLKTEVEEIEIVAGEKREQLVFTGKTEGAFFPADEAASTGFLERHREITGLVLLGPRWRRSWGQTRISLASEADLRLEFDAEIFSQVNRQANSLLVRELLHWGEFHGQDRVLELYSGAGNFTLPVARASREVVAVEAEIRSVEEGKRASQLNGLENIRWIRSPAPEAVKQLRREGERFSKIILDPPRSGAKGLANDMITFGAEKIFYVSCDPSTLARDLAALSAKDYKPRRIRAIDLFPHTFHVEMLAEIVRGA